MSGTLPTLVNGPRTKPCRPKVLLAASRRRACGRHDFHAQRLPDRIAVGFRRAREAAILANAPEVDGDQQRQHRRQHRHVQHVEAQQRLLPDGGVAQQQETRTLSSR